MAKKRKSAKRIQAQVMYTRVAQVPGYALFYPKIKLYVAAIVKEIVDEMNLALASVGKAFSSTALDEWRPKLYQAVLTNVLAGGNWQNDRNNVLTVAHDMAIIAAILSGQSSTVAKGRVHAAFRAVKDHATCPAPLGGGRWCDFDI